MNNIHKCDALSTFDQDTHSVLSLIALLLTLFIVHLSNVIVLLNVWYEIPLHFPTAFSTLLSLSPLLFMTHFRYLLRYVLHFMIQSKKNSHGHLHKLVIEANETERKR